MPCLPPGEFYCGFKIETFATGLEGRASKDAKVMRNNSPLQVAIPEIPRMTFHEARIWCSTESCKRAMPYDIT